jgi:discoidin domain receptor family member 2
MCLCRVRTEVHGGAWCPKEHISKDNHEYLQIEFRQLMVITLVETQGRFGNGQVGQNIEIQSIV